MKKEHPTFEEAFKELEDIVRSLENNTLTIDDMAARIERASQLVAFCRDKLTSTDLEVQKILRNLDQSPGGPSTTDEKQS
ncbi:MAG TPA: exodeoxyribonuclease VII small subunit [Bacteroidales bacterium]|nr:exodeoxyribonuclease VII small subunit [Bacteroidales bacterium]